MEPRPLRDRYKPPNRFLQHINMSGRPGVISELLSNTSGMTDDTVSSLTALSNELQSLLLPATPTEIRTEVDLLLGDLLTRIKQLMFNSLLCAYYVGFIPILFTEVSTGSGLEVLGPSLLNIVGPSFHSTEFCPL